MKKKILLSLLTLTFVVFSFVRVNAATTKAVAIDIEPEAGDDIKALIDDSSFDFSKVSFNLDGASGSITGKTDLFKLFITTNAKKSANLDSPITALLGEEGFWFSAYCLDGNAQTPTMGVYNNDKAQDIQTAAPTMPDQALGAITLSALANQGKFYSTLATKIKGLNYTFPKMTFKLDGSDGDMTFDMLNFSPASGYVGTSDTNKLLAGQAFASVSGAAGSATVYIKSITFEGIGGLETVTLTGAQMNKLENKTEEEYYQFEFNSDDITFDNYSMTKIGNNDYNHALWIIEHSYPSMALTDFLTVAGVDYDKLKDEVGAATSHTGTELDEDIENYVYFTIQYAIWKANGYKDTAGNKLGDTLTFNGSATSELQVIYNYLIQARDEYTNYGNNVYENKITLDDSKNDNVKEEGDFYIYGPYSAKYNVINPSAMEITIDAKTGVTIVDADGNELTNVRNGQKFYVKCKKSAKITNVDLKLTATGKTYKDNSKGKVYYAAYALNQNLLSGTTYEDVNAEKTFTLTYNPKTGVANVGVVFVITLVAFTLGYLVLNYKNKPVELN